MYSRLGETKSFVLLSREYAQLLVDPVCMRKRKLIKCSMIDVIIKPIVFHLERITFCIVYLFVNIEMPSTRIGRKQILFMNRLDQTWKFHLICQIQLLSKLPFYVG